MRDLGDMIQRVRRKTGDYADTMIEDPHIETAITVAADGVWEQMLSHTEANKLLLRYSADDYSSATSLVADQEEYALPNDLLKLYDVEMKTHSDQKYWESVKFQQKPSEQVAYSGNDVLYGNPKDTNWGLSWCGAASPGYICIWPALKNVNGEKIRFRYYAKPQMPDYGTTFNDPDGDGTAEFNLPDRITEAIEWAAVLDLATDKVGANVSYEFALNQYYKIMRTILRTGNPTAPARKYIKRVRG